MNVTIDHDSDFTAAHALFALLESRSLAAGEAEILPYLGMARAELDHPPHLHTDLSTAGQPSFNDGLEQLDKIITGLIQHSDQLDETLRLTRARDLLREGMDRRNPRA